jgi:GTP-binding protein HflX
LLLHVVDAHDEERQTRIDQVNEVLAEIGADELPQLLVYNKIDQSGEAPQLQRDAAGRPVRVWISAVSGAGLELLLEAITELFQESVLHGWLQLSAADGRLRSRLYGLGKVISETVDERGDWSLEIRAPRQELERLFRKEGVAFRFIPIESGDALVAAGGQAP